MLTLWNIQPHSHRRHSTSTSNSRRRMRRFPLAFLKTQHAFNKQNFTVLVYKSMTKTLTLPRKTPVMFRNAAVRGGLEGMAPLVPLIFKGGALAANCSSSFWDRNILLAPCSIKSTVHEKINLVWSKNIAILCLEQLLDVDRSLLTPFPLFTVENPRFSKRFNFSVKGNSQTTSRSGLSS